MLNNASLFLGLRYLQPKRSFVSIITIISVVGIMLGVGVLIVVISVMKGFERDFKNLLMGFEPHVLLIQHRQYEEPPTSEGQPKPQRTKWQQVVPELLKQPNVVSATPFAAGMVFVMSEHESSGTEIYGMRQDGSEAMRSKLTKQLQDYEDPAMAGEKLVFDQVGEPGNQREPKGTMDMEGDVIVINDQLADQLGGLRVGDKVTVLASSNMTEVVSRLGKMNKKMTDAEKAKVIDEIDGFTLQQTLTISGILHADTTGGRCFVPLNTSQELLGLHGDVHGVGVELKDANQAGAFADSLRANKLVPDDWGMNVWTDRHRARLEAIENERVMMWFVLSFVMLVAAFSVLNTTLTVTVQKRREIGILTALGARVSQIVAIFMTQAAVVATIGTLLGYLGGMLVVINRNNIRDFLGHQFNVQIFAKSVYGLDAIPAQTQTSDVLLVCGVAFVFCLAAAFLPSYFAARVDPAVALRD